MAFWGIFNKKRRKDVHVSERKRSTMQDAAVATAFAEAGEHETALDIIDGKKRGYDTILVIGRGECFSERLASYAIDMAKRLDFGIMAVNITEEPLSLPEDERREAVAAFEANCITQSTSFNKKAAGAGIRIYHLILAGTHDEIIEKIHAQYPGMRYVLTEPDPEAVKKAKSNVAIPVFDLGSYHGAAA